MTSTDEETESREDIEEALGHLSHTASRCFPVVGNDNWETPWDKFHKQINSMLDARERLMQEVSA